ncbi:type VI secretion system ATPase TssH [Oceanobacter mangrovi]|uniref:type VI secretion system ATPase TssH n=1 Tax=Oceanobacter mangrovi TaxID=2862510 RepID=UPI001C8E5509|nr:type VI secretion system ATPase TssH [Oceanobacter mangrovi]
MELDKLIKNLADDSRGLLEGAVKTAASRGHAAADLEHWLQEVAQQEPADIRLVLKHFDIDMERLHRESLAAMEQLKTSSDGFPKIAPDIIRLLFEAWMVASTRYESLSIRPVHVLLAVLESEVLRLRVGKVTPCLLEIDVEAFRQQCHGLLTHGEASQQSGSEISKVASKTPALDQFTINLNDQVREGKIPRIIGRDHEIRQMIDILTRKKQNNPILTGEAGVGKTAVVEGLAERIVSGQVPDVLKDVEVHSLDIGLLQAGAGVKGEFENRLKNVIKEVGQSVKPIVIFIDEAHTMIGAGNQAGSGDAANLLKPALARGELRTIAATTWAEYKKYFESDAALTRRFQVVKVEEPDEARAIVMLRSIAPSLEQHHGVVILDEAVVSAVNLSHRYIPGRQLPDKCVSLLDTACARVNLSQSAIPAKLEQCEAEIENLGFEIERLQQEQQDGFDHKVMIEQLQLSLDTHCNQQLGLKAAFDKERGIIDDIISLRQQIEALRLADAGLPGVAGESEASAVSMHQHSAELEQLISQLSRQREALQQLQGKQPLVYECVDANVIAGVISDWTGIPVGRMQTDEINTMLELKQVLEQRVIGQSHGIERIAKSMQIARAGLADPKRPLGVFMLVGPSGVGKTETAMALAEQVYGSEQNITVINMSEFKEEHKVSMLLGAPPGYVGYGEGGVLTEAVRRKPYSVVLLDEMEKAHPGVQDIFYQVFDKGMLKDGEGRDIDFKNTVILMTSNTASAQIEQLCLDPDTRPSPEGLLDAIGPTLRDTYKPAFLGRINLIPYYPLDNECLATIARMQLQAIQQRVTSHYQASLTFTDDVVNFIIEQCQQSDTGARRISILLNNSLLPVLAENVLSWLTKNETVNEIIVSLSDKCDFNINIA